MQARCQRRGRPRTACSIGPGTFLQAREDEVARARTVVGHLDQLSDACVGAEGLEPSLWAF